MLLHTAKNRLRKIGLVIIGCFAFTACSSTDVSYIPRGELKRGFAEEKPRYYFEKRPLEIAAFRLRDKDADDNDQGRLFIIQRKKSTYMAETKMMDTGKKRLFMSVGVDYKNKAPTVGLRLEF